MGEAFWEGFSVGKWVDDWLNVRRLRDLCAIRV
jgi:hypothetical protein